MPIAPAIVSVIDDDESMCRALSRMLRVVGYQVRTYFSAESFLGDQAHPPTSFVVVDLQLGGMSGLDLLRRLGRTQPGLPVALITAHDEPEARSKATAAGCVAFLRKPFPGNQLLDAIQGTLAREPAAASSPTGTLRPTQS